ncbi:Microtubule-associated protein, microtubule dynamics during spindle orientation [Geranomyces variabilis]|uniref:Microtubule-associated protein, microtubule dynamics during spindle orientation n=1 Tax=Geranomyces variabilis TaxID=109894 RepID=A0AAD5TC67_9FUNG|nr:Microtubule-associated protein, microtubule dynamics during spindle orientation [Geranomyces variabilis]
MATDPDEDFTSLPLPERLAHKSWKARSGAYDELATLFGTLDPDDDAAYQKWREYLKKMVGDANAVAQENALAAVLAWVANAPSAAKTRSVIAPMVVDKTMGSNRAGTRQKGLDILLMYIEIDVAEPVIQEIIPGLDHKSPKNVSACVSAMRECLRLFGSPTVNVRPLLKQLSKIFDHKDKNVRAEGTLLALELYRWLGPAMSSSLNDLKPVQIKELQDQFEALPQEKATPERLLRSEQVRIQSLPPPEETNDEGGDAATVTEPEALDSYALAEPVNILDKLEKEFWTEVASKKWQERVAALKGLLEIAQQPRLADGRYGEVISILGKKMADVNMAVMLLSAQCIQAIAAGLRSHFAQYRGLVIHPLLEKFKEKKQNVVDILRDAVDAVYASVTLSEVIEDIVAYSAHKNPQVRSETLRWATRCLKTTRKAPAKPEIKALSEGLVKSLEDGDNVVRECAAEALGTLMKVVSERVLIAYLDKLDNIKQTKVKEFCDQAEVKVTAGAASKPAAASGSRRPASAPAPAKVARTTSPEQNKENASPQARAPARPNSIARAPTKSAAGAPTAAKKRPASAAVGSTTAPAASKPASKGDAPIVYKFSDDSALAYAVETFGEEAIKELSESAWKTRLAAANAILERLQTMPKETVECEAVVRALSTKPGWKESNFQVMSAMINTFQFLAKEISQFNTTAATIIIPGIADKLGDMKIKKVAGDCLSTIAEKLSFQFVLSQAYETFSQQKSPKVLADSLMWIQFTLLEFGTTGLKVRDLIEFLKVALGNTNASVRTNAITVLGTVRMFVGPDVRLFVQDVSPQLLQTIDAEFEKAAAKAPPAVTKQPPPAAENAGDDLFPRIDITVEVTSEVIDMLGDAQWKERKKGLDEVARVIEDSNKRIQPDLGNYLVPALKARLSDSNKNLGMSAVELIGNLAVAVGKPFERYAKVLVGPVTGMLVDQKAHVRGASLASLEKIYSAIGLDSMIGPCATALMAEQPQLRKDLLKWLGEKLEAGEKVPDLSPMVQPVLACLQDKTVEARKGAQTVLPFVVNQVGFETVRDRCADLFKGAALASVTPFLDALRPAKGAAPAPSAGARPGTPSKLRRATTSGPAPPISAAVPRRASAVPGKTTLSRASSALAPRRDTLDMQDDLDAPLLSSDSRAKDQRAAADRGMNKWTFDVPRPELVDLLAEQFQNQVSPAIHAQLFSTDHYKEKFFLAGLTAIDDPISNLPESLDKLATALSLESQELRARYLACADLILKYVTLRFFDTNTSMFLKCLELLDHLFALLDQEGYHMSDYEAAAFLPFFINKTGDPKETMRVKMRGIMKQLTRVYPASKLFNYLLKGLESKNARTRTECLEELASLVQRNSLAVCNPSKAFPLIVAQLADRDAGVRNGALAVISQAYSLVGEAVHKYLGKISEKDKSLIAERLKRMPASSRPASATIAPRRNEDSGRQSPGPRTGTGSRLGAGIGSPARSGSSKPAVNGVYVSLSGRSSPALMAADEPRGPSVLENAHQGSAPVGVQNYRQFSLNMDKPAGIRPPTRSFSPAQVSSRLQSFTPPGSPGMSNQLDRAGDVQAVPEPQFSPNPLSRTTSITTEATYQIDMLLTQITDNDVFVATSALKRLNRLLCQDIESVAPYLGACVPTLILQFRVTTAKIPFIDDPTKKYVRYLLNALVAVFNTTTTAQAVAQDHVEQLCSEIMKLINQPDVKKASELEDATSAILKSMNSLIIKILDKCNRNMMFYICLKVLMDCTDMLSTNDPSQRETALRRQDSPKRCLWKLVKICSANEINVGRLLRDVQDLFTERPLIHWQALQRETNLTEAAVPINIAKNICARLVQQLGSDIFNHMDELKEFDGYDWVSQYIKTAHTKYANEGFAFGSSGFGTPSQGSQLDLSSPAAATSSAPPGTSIPGSPRTSRTARASVPAPARPSSLAYEVTRDDRETTDVTNDRNSVRNHVKPGYLAGSEDAVRPTAQNGVHDTTTFARPTSLPSAVPPASVTDMVSALADVVDSFHKRWPEDRILQEHPLHTRIPVENLQRQIADLFVRLRIKEQLSEGMDELYALREKHPYAQAVIEQELGEANRFFRKYIMSQLAMKDAEVTGAPRAADLLVADSDRLLAAQRQQWENRPQFAASRINMSDESRQTLSRQGSRSAVDTPENIDQPLVNAASRLRSFPSSPRSGSGPPSPRAEDIRSVVDSAEEGRQAAARFAALKERLKDHHSTHQDWAGQLNGSDDTI